MDSSTYQSRGKKPRGKSHNNISRFLFLEEQKQPEVPKSRGNNFENFLETHFYISRKIQKSSSIFFPRDSQV